MPTKKGRKVTKRNKPLKGGFYSFAGAVGTGAPLYHQKTEMQNPEVGSRGGNSQYWTGGRRKKGKGKKTRKMKGGTYFGQAVSGFTGHGVNRGMGGFQDVSSPQGKAAEGGFANYGAQPGSGYGSFITTKSN